MKKLLLLFSSCLILSAGSVRAENPHEIEVTPEEGELYSLGDFVLTFPSIVEYTGSGESAPYLLTPDQTRLPLQVSFEGMAYECCRLSLAETLSAPGNYRLILPDGSFRVGLDWYIMPTSFSYTLIPSPFDPGAGISSAGQDSRPLVTFTLSGLPIGDSGKGIVIDSEGRKMVRSGR